VPKVKKGDKVFINGGSGGCGVYGIQIAKAIGCYVATSCSSRNVELCKSLGADQVVDYTKQKPAEALQGQGFDHVVDNVGNDLSLYSRSHEYTRPGAVYIQVASDLSLQSAVQGFTTKLPSFLGGGQRRREGILAQLRYDDLKQIGEWMEEGKIKAVIDQRFKFEEAPKAFEKLKTGRARGKIVVEVGGAV
jgi:NADPH:quinone reductase-like Zn-dependent oxidoreductase